MKKKISGFLTPLMFATFMVPIDDQSQWQVLKYSSIPANKTKFSSKGLTVGVMSSSSPLLYPFSRPTKIKKIKLTARVVGGLPPRIPAAITQGTQGYDDFPLRLGVVKLGTKRLNWIQRQLAPDWLVTLYKMLPKGVGVECIKFFSVASNAKDIGMKRKHPLADIIEEEVVTSVQPDGKIYIEQRFKKPITALALWLGVDGDDTKSTYQVHISDITVEEEM